jgi:hypothetical protein
MLKYVDITQSTVRTEQIQNSLPAPRNTMYIWISPDIYIKIFLLNGLSLSMLDLYLQSPIRLRGVVLN